MTSSSIRRTTRPIEREVPRHLFNIGQAVRLKGGFNGSAMPADVYHITRTLPPLGVSLQYRIRNNDERYERVTTQDSIEPVGTSQQSSGTTLIERTFGHGQGAKNEAIARSENLSRKGQSQA